MSTTTTTSSASTPLSSGPSRVTSSSRAAGSRPRSSPPSPRTGQLQGGEQMSRRQLDIRAHAPAAPEVVFGLLADGASWPLWSPIESFELERPGDPPPEGPGAVRSSGEAALPAATRSSRWFPVAVWATSRFQPCRSATITPPSTSSQPATGRRSGGGRRSSPGPRHRTAPGAGLGRFLDQCTRGPAAQAADALSTPDATA
jgi:hypothetical protein